MPALRRLVVGLAACLAAGLLGTPAHAARPVLPHSVVSLSTPHFVVWYTSDTTSSDYTTFTQASDLAARLERLYTLELGWGFQAPLPDADAKIDVYLQTPTRNDPAAGVAGDAIADNPAGPTSSGYIVLNPLAREDAATIAHELFHLIEYATWVPTPQTDTWLTEGAAEWAGAKADGFSSADASGVGPSDLPLDCRDNLVPSPSTYQMCSPAFAVEGGYSRWPFFEAIAARFGMTFVQDVLQRGAAGSSAIDALDAAIRARGATLADVYGDWAIQQIDGGYGIPSLDTKAVTPYATVTTGAQDGTQTVSLSVDHLSTRYIRLLRGDGSGDHPCFAATLTVTVKNKNGVTSRPFVYWNQKGSAPVPLAVSGDTATASIPWDTCLWPSNAAYLAIPNATAGSPYDSAMFDVTTQLRIDPSFTPASPTAAPAQGPVYGGVTPVSNADVPPSILLFGPLLLKVSAAAPVLRLIVESSGEGKVHAQLGSVDLGSPDLRAGNNDLRFKVPTSLLATLRRSAAAGNVLTLTPLSSSGAATGAAVTRTVAVAPVAHKAKKKK